MGGPGGRARRGAWAGARGPVWGGFLAVLLGGLAGCVGPRAASGGGVAGGAEAGGPAAGGPAGEAQRGKISRAAGRPAVVVLPREGGPYAAVALVSAGAGGVAAHTALAAVIEARLRSGGLLAAGSGDRDGLRVTVLAQDAAGVEGAAKALSEAALRPLGEADAGGVKLAAARVAALRAQGLDAPALEDFAACTGEAAPSGEPLPALSGAEGAAQIEGWRKQLGALRSALGVVGPAALVQRGAEAVAAGPAWPDGAAAAEKRPPAGPPVVYAEAGRKRGTARVTAAVWFDDPESGPQAAERLGQSTAPVAARLRGMRGEVSLRRISGVARQGGSCVSVSAEAGGLESSWLEEEAAAVAAVLEQEIQAGAADSAGTLARRLEGLGDPREAAAALAWWSLSSRGSGGTVARVALGVAPEPGSPRSEAANPGGLGSAQSNRRFAVAYEGLKKGSGALETRVSQEAGQGQLRLLLANACPVVEAPGEHGSTSVALLAAIGGAASDGVELEPWLSPGGAGVLARARPRAGESAEALGARVAGAAARVLVGEPPRPEQIQAARGALLGRMGPEVWPPVLWATLAPDQPSRLFVSGSVDGVARSSVESIRLRWSRLAAGPLRVAALTTRSEGQLEAIGKAVERWQLPSLRGATCAAAALGPAAAGGAVLPAGPRAFLSFRVDATGSSAGAAAMTALMLGAAGGALEQALAGLGVTAQAFVAGQGAEAALVIELRGPQESLEAAIDRSKGALEKREELIDGEPGRRAAARWAELEREQQLDPRQRLIDLWSGVTRPTAPAAPEWKRWAREQLALSRSVVLRPGR